MAIATIQSGARPGQSGPTSGPIPGNAPGLAADAEQELERTPAELPSGRVSFRDELGRETAFEQRRQRGDGSGDDAELAELAALNGAAPVVPIAPTIPSAPNAAADPTALLTAAATTDGPTPASVTALLDGDGLALVAGAKPVAPATKGEAPAPALAVPMPDAEEPPGIGALRPDELLAQLPELPELADDEALELAAAPPRSAAKATEEPPFADAASLAALLEVVRRHESPAASAPASIDPARAAAPAERAVALAELPRALRDEIDGFLRLRSHDRRWEAEIRLDPPELGSLHVRLELRGHALHAVVRTDDPTLQPQIERTLKELEQQLQREGGEAFLELGQGLDRGTPREHEGKREAEAAGRERAVASPEPALAPRGSGRDADRLVDLLA
jgi:hypothetical protein